MRSWSGSGIVASYRQSRRLKYVPMSIGLSWRRWLTRLQIVAMGNNRISMVRSLHRVGLQRRDLHGRAAVFLGSPVRLRESASGSWWAFVSLLVWETRWHGSTLTGLAIEGLTKTQRRVTDRGCSGDIPYSGNA